MKPNTPADVGFRYLNPTYKSRCYLILIPQRQDKTQNDPIVEPQGVYQLATGEWVMSQECL